MPCPRLYKDLSDSGWWAGGGCQGKDLDRGLDRDRDIGHDVDRGLVRGLVLVLGKIPLTII